MKSLSWKGVARFWRKVNKNISNVFYNGERCWEWEGARDPRYGLVRVGNNTEKAHRVAWVIANGEIPDNLHVLHHCDNPPCVRVSHLFLGTQKDNAQDREMKGRGVYSFGEKNGHYTHPEKTPRGDKSGSRLHPEKYRGENGGLAKLTWEQVREIRRRYRWLGIGGDSTHTLAKEFGVSKSGIHAILKNKTWKE